MSEHHGEEAENPLRELSDEELISRLKALYDSIYNVRCYSYRDLLMLEAVSDELERRGYVIRERVDVEVDREDC